MDVRRVEGRLLRALLGWAGTSVVAGSALAVVGARTGRPAMEGFGLQSALWGGVDAAIAVPALVRRRRGGPPPGARRLRTVLLVNAAADVGYVLVGALLLARPAEAAARLGRPTPEALRGHAVAVVVQGAYLLVADAAAAAALRT